MLCSEIISSLHIFKAHHGTLAINIENLKKRKALKWLLYIIFLKLCMYFKKYCIPWLLINEIESWSHDCCNKTAVKLEFTYSSSKALHYEWFGQARHTHMWPIITMKCAGTKSGICICLQRGLNWASGKELPFHKVYSWTLNTYLWLKRERKKYCADENVGISLALKCYFVHSKNM